MIMHGSRWSRWLLKTASVFILLTALLLLVAPVLQAKPGGEGCSCDSAVTFEAGQTLWWKYGDHDHNHSTPEIWYKEKCDSVGESGKFHAMSESDKRRRSYIKFDIRDVSNASVSSATLTIQADGAFDGNVTVYQVFGGFDCGVDLKKAQGDTLVSSGAVSGTSHPFMLNGVDWSGNYLYLAFAITNDTTTTTNQHVDFKCPCIEITYAPGKIIVDKVTDPAEDLQLFTFTPDWGSSFQLADATTPYDSGSLSPGTYTVTETVPAGWELTSIDGADSESGAEATIDLAAGEDVTVTFTNTRKTHTVTVEKDVSPTGDPGKFDLKINGVVQHGDSTSAVTVNVGDTVTISELGGTNTTLANYSSVLSSLGVTFTSNNDTSGSFTMPDSPMRPTR